MSDSKYKQLLLEKEVHKNFKIYAIKKEIDMKDLLKEIVIEKMESDPIGE